MVANVMGLQERSPIYTSNESTWRQNFSVVAGEEFVKDNTTEYLPKLSEAQSQPQYDRLLTLASLFAGSARAVESYMGIMGHRQISVDGPMAENDFFSNVDLKGNTLEAFVSEATREAIITRHNAIYIDTPIPGQEFSNLLEEQRAGIRPFWKHVKALDILDWDYDESIAHRPLNFVKFVERSTRLKNENNPDDFTRENVKTYTVLQLTDGVYRKRIYEESSMGLRLILDETPTYNGRTLDFIPFTFLQATEDVKKSIISDMVAVNLAHYRMTAALNYALTQTATPFLTITGDVDEDTDFTLGPDAPLVLASGDQGPAPQATWTEIQGTGVNGMALQITRYEEQMARLGASVLAPQLNQAETAQALSLKKSDEVAALVALQRDINDGLDMAINMTAIILGVGIGNVAELSTDFTSETLDPQLLAQMMAGVQSGVTPLRLIWKLYRDTESITEIESYEEFLVSLRETQEFLGEMGMLDDGIEEDVEEDAEEPTDFEEGGDTSNLR